MKKWRTLALQSFREGSVQVWRNKFLSGTTILLGALILFLLNFVFSIRFFADYSLQNLESRADFSVRLEEKFDAFEFDALKNELQEFQVQMNLLEAEQREDFSIPPRLHVQFQDLREVGEVFEILKKNRYSLVVGDWDSTGERDFVHLIDKLIGLRDNVTTISFWLTLIFLIGGVLLVVNTFRIVLFSRKEEIFIARLSGAEPRFITGPFLVEGFLLGVMSSLIAIFTFILLLREIEGLPGGDIFLYLWNSVFSLEILVAGGIGVLGAWISVRKYLTGHFEQ